MAQATQAPKRPHGAKRYVLMPAAAWTLLLAPLAFGQETAPSGDGASQQVRITIQMGAQMDMSDEQKPTVLGVEDDKGIRPLVGNAVRYAAISSNGAASRRPPSPPGRASDR